VSCQRGSGQGDGRVDGHANMSTTLNVYMQVVGESKGLAIEKVGEINWTDIGQIAEDGKNLLM
jgi:hypothetical protein